MDIFIDVYDDLKALQRPKKNNFIVAQVFDPKNQPTYKILLKQETH